MPTEHSPEPSARAVGGGVRDPPRLPGGPAGPAGGLRGGQHRTGPAARRPGRRTRCGRGAGPCSTSPAASSGWRPGTGCCSGSSWSRGTGSTCSSCTLTGPPAGSVRRCSTWSRACARTASGCGSTRSTSGPGPSTPGTGWSSSSAPTAAATSTRSRTCRWPGSASDPLAYLRRRIDAVDDELAVLLARRTALTAAVQDHKATTGEYAGQRGRDAEREAEIVARMAQHVPELGPERIARVMHTVIEESIAAWESGGSPPLLTEWPIRPFALPIGVSRAGRSDRPGTALDMLRVMSGGPAMLTYADLLPRTTRPPEHQPACAEDGCPPQSSGKG